MHLELGRFEGALGAQAPAREALSVATAIAQLFGMVALTKQVEAVCQTLAPAATAIAPDGLTLREIEVSPKVAAGQTNQEAGYDLSISGKTVAAHIYNSFLSWRRAVPR